MQNILVRFAARAAAVWIAVVAASAAAWAADITIADDDLVLGKADAPVTMVEYASLTCPHCAHFNVTAMPTLKEKYIDTGKVRYVYRDFPLDRLALTAALLPRCVDNTRAFAFIDVLYQRQGSWARARDPIAALKEIARLGGVDDATFDTCLKDRAKLQMILKKRLYASEELKIRGTPTIFLNGKMYEGANSPEAVGKAIDDLLPKS